MLAAGARQIAPSSYAWSTARVHKERLIPSNFPRWSLDLGIWGFGDLDWVVGNLSRFRRFARVSLFPRRLDVTDHRHWPLRRRRKFVAACSLRNPTPGRSR